MNPTDKVTLEWLMRFEGVERINGPYGEEGVLSKVTETKGEVEVSAQVDRHIKDVYVNLLLVTDYIRLANPTIARFHEAVAFLGATLKPLRPGEP